MPATSAFVRLFIRGLAWDADASNTTFVETLKAAARARLADSAKGKVLIGSGSGGTTVTYSLPPLGNLTPQDLAEVCSKLLDRVDAIALAHPTYGDEALKNALLSAFPSLRVTSPDFSGFRRW